MRLRRPLLGTLKFPKITQIPVNPVTCPAPPHIPPARQKNLCDPDTAFADLSIKDFLQVWVLRYQVSLHGFRRKVIQHDFFELMLHMIFPKPEERALVYVAVWHYRDGLSDDEIAERLRGFTRGYKARLKITPERVATYRRYINMVVRSFINRHRLDTKAMADPLPEAEEPEEVAREVLSGRG